MLVMLVNSPMEKVFVSRVHQTQSQGHEHVLVTLADPDLNLIVLNHHALNAILGIIQQMEFVNLVL